MITIPGSAAGLVFGIILASVYGALFHVIFGGSLKMVIIYVIAAWIGFLIGQFVGDLINFEFLKLGKVHLVSASIGAWLALLSTWWLVGQNNHSR